MMLNCIADVLMNATLKPDARIISPKAQSCKRCVIRSFMEAKLEAANVITGEKIGNVKIWWNFEALVRIDAQDPVAPRSLKRKIASNGKITGPIVPVKRERVVSRDL
jgi:hypothetical protein